VKKPAERIYAGFGNGYASEKLPVLPAYPLAREFGFIRRDAT